MAAKKLTAVEEIQKLANDFEEAVKKKADDANEGLATQLGDLSNSAIGMKGHIIFSDNVKEAYFKLGRDFGFDQTPSTDTKWSSSQPKKRVKKEEKQKHWDSFIKGLDGKTFTLPELNLYMEENEPLYDGNIDAFMKPITKPLLMNTTLTKATPTTGNKLIKVWTIK